MIKLRVSISLIFLAFPALMLSYIFFLSDLGDIFDGLIRHAPFLHAMDQGLSGVFNVQFISLMVTALLIAGALAFQPGASSHKILRYIPFILVLIPLIIFLFVWKCALGLVSSEVCNQPAFSGGWGNLLYPPFLLVLLVLALAVWHSSISRQVLIAALIPLSIAALGMVYQAVLVISWGIRAWPTPQAEVAYLAQGYDRSLWPGDWHIWLVVGILLVAFFAGLAVYSAWRGWRAATDSSYESKNGEYHFKL